LRGRGEKEMGGGLRGGLGRSGLMGKRKETNRGGKGVGWGRGGRVDSGSRPCRLG